MLLSIHHQHVDILIVVDLIIDVLVCMSIVVVALVSICVCTSRTISISIHLSYSSVHIPFFRSFSSYLFDYV